jgi:flagellar motor switch protein FliG
MRIPIIDIGNSKGIRIPQAILKQVMFSDEVEMDVTEGRIILKKAIDPSFVPDFNSLAQLSDSDLQTILKKINGVDLVSALVGADSDVKEAVYRNLSPRVKNYLIPTIERLEKGDARDLIIERSRNIVCEVLMEIAHG